MAQAMLTDKFINYQKESFEYRDSLNFEDNRYISKVLSISASDILCINSQNSCVEKVGAPFDLEINTNLQQDDETGETVVELSIPNLVGEAAVEDQDQVGYIIVATAENLFPTIKFQDIIEMNESNQGEENAKKRVDIPSKYGEEKSKFVTENFKMDIEVNFKVPASGVDLR